MTTEQPKRRGRPPTGNAMTAAERKAKQRAAIKEEGGRELNGVRLTPQAARALARHTMPTETDAVNHAIVETWKRKKQ